MFYPSYLNLYHSGELKKRVEQALKVLRSCHLCPRRCGANRELNQLGFCRSGKDLIIYSSQPHFGEEPPISGVSGSGTIFFSNCHLSCIYCQNYSFSQLGQGESISPEGLAELMIKLKDSGCHNINLVSPTHFLPQILKGLELAIGRGLDIPLVYNSNGYESVSILKLLEGIVDIYLPDFRYSQEEAAQKYSGVSGYWEIARRAIKEMYRQAGNLKLKNHLAFRGVLVRHLILPEDLAGTKKIMDFLSKEVSAEIHVSLMSQYYPAFKAGQFPPLNRTITNQEYEKGKQWFKEAGLKNGWFQDKPGKKEMKRFAGEYLSRQGFIQ